MSVFGASHLCIACCDINPRYAELYSRDYAAKFSERNVLNPAAKLPFLRKPTAVHSMLFLTSPARLSLELLPSGGEGGATRLGYEPVVEVTGDLFDSLSEAPDTTCEQLAALLDRPVRPLGSGAFRCFASRTEGASGGIKAIALACADVRASTEFWTQGLGLSPGPEAAGGARLSLRSISASWGITLLLHPAGHAKQNMFLDDEGPNCLSFFTRGHEQWREKRMRHGACDHGEAFTFQAGSKDLNAVFLRGPSGELVELLDYA